MYKRLETCVTKHTNLQAKLVLKTMSIVEKVHGYECWEIDEFVQEQRALDSGRWEIRPGWMATNVRKVSNGMSRKRKTNISEYLNS